MNQLFAFRRKSQAMVLRRRKKQLSAKSVYVKMPILVETWPIQNQFQVGCCVNSVNKHSSVLHVHAKTNSRVSPQHEGGRPTCSDTMERCYGRVGTSCNC